MAKEVHVYTESKKSVPAVFLNVFDGDGSDVWEACRRMRTKAFSLIAVSGLDWDAELSPWPEKGVFGREDFAGGADAYLRELTEEIMPEVEKQLAEPPLWRAVAGYSLAGLFALYALYRTDVFDRAATVSGSLWFPGFKDFAMRTPLKAEAGAIYLSLGNKESRVRDPLLASNDQTTSELAAYFGTLGIPAVYEVNAGNHFREPEVRTAKAIRWLTGRVE